MHFCQAVSTNCSHSSQNRQNHLLSPVGTVSVLTNFAEKSKKKQKTIIKTLIRCVGLRSWEVLYAHTFNLWLELNMCLVRLVLNQLPLAQRDDENFCLCMCVCVSTWQAPGSITKGSAHKESGVFTNDFNQKCFFSHDAVLPTNQPNRVSEVMSPFI